MRRAAVLLGLLCSVSAAAVPITAPGEAHTRPRVPVTLGFKLHNPAAQAVQESLTLDAPAGWKIALAPSELAMEAGEERVELFMVVPPNDASAGSYPVQLRAGTFTATAQVVVQPVREATVQVEHAPEFSTSGTYRLSWRVINRSNITEQFTLTTTDNLKAHIALDAPVLTLKPGESRVVTAQVSVANPAKSQMHQVRLTAVAAGALKVTALARVEVIPPASALPLESRYHIVPVTLTGTVTTNALGQTQLQGELHASGTLTQDDPGKFGVHLTQTRKVISYARENFSVAAGNYSTGFGSLAPRSDAVGVTTSFKVGGLPVQAQGGVSASGAAQVGVALTPTFTSENLRVVGQVALNQQDGRLLASAEGALTTSITAFRAAYVRDLTVGSWAASASTAYSTPQNSASLSWRGSSSGWYGAVAPSNELTARASAQFTPHLSGQMQARVLDFDLKRSVLGLSLEYANKEVRGSLRYFRDTTGPTGKLQSFSVSYRHAVASSVTAQHRLTWQEMTPWGMNVPDTSSAMYQLSTNIRMGNGSVSPSASVGLSLKDSKVNLGLGITGTQRITPSTSLNYMVSTPDLTRVDFNVGLASEIPLSDQTKLKVTAGMGRLNNQWSAQARVSGTLTLNVPVHERRDIAKLQGRFTLQGRPVPGVIIRAGTLATLTDQDGRYSFPALAPGTVALRIQTDSLPGNTLFQPVLPPNLVLTAGEERTLDINAILSGTVTGQIIMITPEAGLLVSGQFVQDVPALARLTVLLVDQQGQEQRLRVETDGTFQASNLLPGRYQLSLAPETAAIVAQHQLDLPGVVNILSGQAAEVQAQLTIRPRSITITEGGEVPDEAETPERR